MAKEFTYTADGETVQEWAETEDEAIERACEALDDHGIDLDEEAIREHIEVVPSPNRIKSGAEGVFDERRRRAGERAAQELIEDGMDVGLGTGSTTAWTVAEIGRLLREGDLEDVRGVATSLQSHELAKEADIPLVTLDAVTELDITVDGADQYSENEPTVIKGGGGAHAREKVIDAMADELVITTDEEKATDPLDYPVPVEVMPDAREVVAEWVREAGGEPDLRMAERKDGPVFTANGNLVLDCDFGGLDDAAGTAQELDGIPGVLDHGIFLDMVDAVYLGTDEDVDVLEF
ncbi:ribose-5-phosphate isomerase RpiA [Halococcus saccharolyticus]|uniref:Ribose-5-phosphate isomerase A n=1 Tax=Halococcus saccharolyticus DSM 5350 TaxID=1227455 RepID=M0MR53_9EURY|nr:ribose-5-phosphate isomerase RpiA [Halococcus saccharolyticus]EMA46940.1 ribose-5-phosphate isomerase A [Halococcus saccharolyticus DSM 5350]